MSTCPYHKKVHTEDECKTTHKHCVNHGHCLNPIQCPMFESCPAHSGGKNMFLAWSAPGFR